jgi:transcriptional regulator with PAS, ATPase and Fis domain
LVVPPLRERTDDILPLARFFIEHYNTKFKRQIEGISPDAVRLLLGHDWPGNVRELRNAIERAMILEDTGLIRPWSLPIAVRGDDWEPSKFAVASVSADSMVPEDGAKDGMSLADQERRLVVQALENSGGNQTQAARLLRITRDTLRYKMKKFNLR